MDNHEYFRWIVTFFADVTGVACAHLIGAKLGAKASRFSITWNSRLVAVGASVAAIVLALQWVVYESFIGSRPEWVYFIFVGLILIAIIWWLCFALSSSRLKSAIVPEASYPRFPRVVRPARIVLFTLPLLITIAVGMWVYLQYMPSEDRVILVTNFSGAPDSSLTTNLVRELQAAARTTAHVKVKYVDIAVSAKQGRDPALELARPIVGTRNTATLVVWGWVENSVSDREVTINIDPVHDCSCGTAFLQRRGIDVGAASSSSSMTFARYVVPIEHLNRFTFQPSFATEMRAKSFYILGIMSLMVGEFEDAYSNLNVAYEAASSDLYPKVLVARGLAEIGRARSRMIIVTPGIKNIEEALSWLKDARAECQAAVMLGERLGHFCLGQGYLTTGDLALMFPRNLAPEFEKRATQGFDKAVSECGQAVDAVPDYIPPYACRADALASLGVIQADYQIGVRTIKPEARSSFQQALADWNHIVEVNPRDVGAYGHRGEVFFFMGDSDNAERDFTKAVDLRNSDFTSFNNRGLVREHGNRLEDALADFEHSALIAPEFPPTWCYIGRTLRKLKRFRAAREALENCQRLASGTQMVDEASEELRKLP